MKHLAQSWGKELKCLIIRKLSRVQKSEATDPESSFPCFVNVGELLSCKILRLMVLTNQGNDLNKAKQTCKTDQHDRQPKWTKWMFLKTSQKEETSQKQAKEMRIQACMAVVNLFLWARLC